MSCLKGIECILVKVFEFYLVTRSLHIFTQLRFLVVLLLFDFPLFVSVFLRD
jgi:hypothetical protein